MPGKKGKKGRGKIPNGHRWCDRPDFVGPSKGPPGYAVYLLCTPHGWFTDKEEFYWWRIAIGIPSKKALREVYLLEKTGSKSQPKPKQIKRAEDLKIMHENGEIDLYEGPWKYYGNLCGQEGVQTRLDLARVKDYGNVGIHDAELRQD